MAMDQKTKIVLAWELHEQGVSNSQIAKRLEANRDTVNGWVHDITDQGLLPFLESRHQGKRKPRLPRQVPLLVKQKVWQLREREINCCGQKIAYFLAKEQGVELSVPKIYEILAERYVIRSKWKKNKARGPMPQALASREIVEMDTIDFGNVFAFTAVDIFSREADVLLRPSLTAKDGLAFLQWCMPQRFDGRVQLIQTDGGSEFEAEFAQSVGDYCDRHRISRPYKKNEQAHIESFNRTVRKECLGWHKYKPEQIPKMTREVELFLARYHYHRPHMAFEPMRPPLVK